MTTRIVANTARLSPANWQKQCGTVSVQLSRKKIPYHFGIMYRYYLFGVSIGSVYRENKKWFVRMHIGEHPFTILNVKSFAAGELLLKQMLHKSKGEKNYVR